MIFAMKKPTPEVLELVRSSISELATDYIQELKHSLEQSNSSRKFSIY